MHGASSIRILAADDHPLIRAGLVSFLATEPGLEVVAEAGNGEEALEKYREFQPDVVLMDLSMPLMDGLTATRAILDEFAGARVIVLTTYGGDEDIWGGEPSTEDSSDAVAISDAIARVLATRNPLHQRIIQLYGPELIDGGEDLSGAGVVERLGAGGEQVTVDNVQQVWRRFKVDLKAELDSGEDGGTSDG